MKKLLIALILTLWMTANALAAGTVTQSMASFGADNKVVVTFVCTGDASDGSIPNTALAIGTYNVVKGMYLYEVEAYPTAGGTAPDAADVFILDKNDIDLLGSEDEGTTAYEGLTLIHATLSRVAKPNLYLPRAGNHAHYYPIIKSVPTLKVSNQGTASANYTIVMTFVK